MLHITEIKAETSAEEWSRHLDAARKAEPLRGMVGVTAYETDTAARYLALMTRGSERARATSFDGARISNAEARELRGLGRAA